MRYFKLISGINAFYVMAENKFQAMKWFNESYGHKFSRPSIIAVDVNDFKFTVEIKQFHTGVTMVGSYTMNEIKSFVAKTKRIMQKNEINTITAGDVIDFQNNALDLNLSVNKHQPFPVIDHFLVERSKSCLSIFLKINWAVYIMCWQTMLKKPC